MNGSTRHDDPTSSADNVAVRRQGNASLVKDDKLTKNEMCGCFLTGYPQWLQRLASTKFFVAIVTLQIFLIALYYTIIQLALTTLETRYQWSISELGLFTSVFTAGSIVSTLLVTHFGGRPTSSRPVWLGVSGLIFSLGLFLHTVPQFMFAPYQPLSSGFFEPSASNTSEIPTGLCAADAGNTVDENEDVCEEKDRQILLENNITFIFFIIGEILVGVGYGPILPIALTYVHDSANDGTTGLVSGIFESIYGIGSIIGFQVASAFLSLWVDFYRVDVSTLTVTLYDYNWVGAWWFGFLVISILYALLSLPIFMFPNQLKRENDKSAIKEIEGIDLGEKDTAEEVKTSALTNLKEWPRSVWRLCKNVVFVMGTLSFITEGALFYSMFTFFPKYLQDQFHIDVFTAGTITGFALIPAWALGALIGGVLVKIMNLRVKGMSALCWTTGLISCGLTVAMIFVGCSNPAIAGVSVGYQGNDLQTISVDAPCNSDCFCDPEMVFTPVCGSDGVTYFSPCHAGCTETPVNETFTGCSCLDYSFPSSSLTPPTLTNGQCADNCSNLLLFIVLCVLWVGLMAISSAPRNTIILSAVDPTDKSFALGLSRVLMLLIGSLPFPVLYGLCIDSACTVWQYLCGERGYCDIYDIEKFRVILFGLSTALTILQFIAFFVIWLVARRNGDGRDNEEKEQKYGVSGPGEPKEKNNE